MSRYRVRRRRNAAALGLTVAATLLGLGWLALILGALFREGAAGLSLSLFAKSTPPPGAGGGLANAIVGSVLMTVLALAVGTPLGILAATYLAEYGRGTRLARTVRTANDILLSAPSIVIGLFVYQIMVVPLGHFSGYAGALALALIVIPVVVRASEDMLAAVPDELREAAVSVGMPRAVMIARIAYRAARAGIVTGIILGLARISGETAPLLFTALNNQFFSLDLGSPIASIPATIYQFALSPYREWQQLAWTGALIVTLAVLALSILARSLRNTGNST